MTEKIRSFICLEISEEARAEVARVQAELRQEAADISWTRADGFHLTLKFLGDIEPTAVPDLSDAIEQLTHEIEPFALELDCAGAFPNTKNPRVLWVGLRGNLAALNILQGKLEERLESFGFKRDGKPFRPHLTLGRVQRPRGSEAVARHLVDARFHPAGFVVTEIVLMRSDLRPTGARYTSLARAALGARV